MLTFLEVVFLCDKEIDSKMLKRTAKWFTVKEIEAWKDNEAEQTSYERVVSFLPGVYTVLRI
jgi:hypothetical protein